MSTVYIKKTNGVPQSPYYYAIYQSADGKRISKSTGLKKKREAKRLADEWEQEQLKLRKKNSNRNRDLSDTLASAFTEMNKGAFNLDKFNAYLAKGYEIVIGKEAKSPTLERHIKEWLFNKEEFVSEQTYENYKSHMQNVLDHSGDIRNKLLVQLTTSDLETIQRNLLNKRKEIGGKKKTINLKMKILKIALKDAYRKGLILRDIGLAIKHLPQDDSDNRGAFTMDEIERLIKVAPHSWKGAILFAAQTGLRCKNIVNLQWENLNLERKILSVIPVKQGRIREKKVRHFPLTEEMLGYLNFIGIKEKGYLFPEAASYHPKCLPRKFREIMTTAKVPAEVQRDQRREVRSFHSLRHSFNTFLAQAEVSQDMRMKITGHSTAAINEIYTHRKEEELHNVVKDALPSVQWRDAK